MAEEVGEIEGSGAEMGYEATNGSPWAGQAAVVRACQA